MPANGDATAPKEYGRDHEVLSRPLTLNGCRAWMSIGRSAHRRHNEKSELGGNGGLEGKCNRADSNQQQRVSPGKKKKKKKEGKDERERYLVGKLLKKTPNCPKKGSPHHPLRNQETRGAREPVKSRNKAEGHQLKKGRDRHGGGCIPRQAVPNSLAGPGCSGRWEHGKRRKAFRNQCWKNGVQTMILGVFPSRNIRGRGGQSQEI